MAAYARQLECLSCSNSRTFIHHSDSSSRVVSQMEVASLPKSAYITCGRCGSSSLISTWGDATPYATRGYVGRRRRRRNAAATAAAAPETATPVVAAR